MAVVADYPDDPEDDNGESNAEKLVDIGQFAQMMQKRFSLSEHIERIVSQVNQFESLSAKNLSKALSDAIPSISQTLNSIQPEMPSPSQIAASFRIAAADYSRIDKTLLAAQLGVQSQIEACKTALEFVFPMNREILLNGVSQIQAALGTSKITQDWLQESYSNAIRAISDSAFSRQDLVYESVRRVLERKSVAFNVAQQWATQDLSEALATAQAIIDYRGLAVEAALIQRAITPFVREWAWLVCDAKFVSVDIEHDREPFLYAEYDRETVIELLTARFALEETQPEVSITASGELENRDDLLECSGEHGSHSAHYYGETVLDSEENESKKKALSECLDELRQKGIFDEETWDQIELNARRAERFAREIFADVMHAAMLYTLELATLYVKENPLSADEFRAHQEKAFARLRKLLPKPDEGRPKGTGLFRDEGDFLIALKEVLQKSSAKLSQRQALHAIRQHPLCQKQTAQMPSQNETKTLRNWLDKCGMKYKDALEKYWKPAEKGK